MPRCFADIPCSPVGEFFSGTIGDYISVIDSIDYLRSIGMDVNMSFRDIKETGKNYLFINHTLDINDIIISAALLKRVSDTLA